MIRRRDNKQPPLIDPWCFLGPRRRKLLDSSWPGAFRQFCLPHLPADELAGCFHEGAGAPTKELYTSLGCVVLQQIHDLTDPETIEALAFNGQWHYAFDLPGEADRDKYMCEKTLRNTRRNVINLELDRAMFDRVTAVLAKAFGVDTSKQRLDSVHIQSNMRRLGRLNIFAKCIHKFLKNLKRQRPNSAAELEADLPELVGRYLTEKAVGCFSMVKPSEAAKRLEDVAKDLVVLVERFGDSPEVRDLPSYKLVCRVMREQMDTDGPITLKPAKKVAPDSLQNPSDPDASYNAHKGQGYHAQVSETYVETDPESDNEVAPPRLITNVYVEPAHVHDSHAVIPTLESLAAKDMCPAVELADSLYGSDDNVEKAQEMGVELVAPTMPGQVVDDGRFELADFAIENKRVAACPRGHAPVGTNNGKNGLLARFDPAVCAACPDRERCPAKPGKRWYTLAYTAKTIRLATRRAYERTEAFKDTYRMRSGVEATFSEMDRRTRVKHLRVRGLPAVSFAVMLRALGVNLFRVTRYQCALAGATG